MAKRLLENKPFGVGSASMSVEAIMEITQERYDELEACEALLEQVMDDQGMWPIYREQYPELVEAAGYILSDDEEAVS
jgi:hypothetical protein